MKIAIAQLNYHIGNFQENSLKIIQHIQKAQAENVDLIIFSELSVCGYPPNDLLERKEFLVWTQQAVEKIVTASKGIAVIIGAPTINISQKGKKLHNSAIFINDGRIEKIIHKTLLPTYDIFDE